MADLFNTSVNSFRDVILEMLAEVDIKAVNVGIGAYEFWGSCRVDNRYALEACAGKATRVFTDEEDWECVSCPEGKYEGEVTVGEYDTPVWVVATVKDHAIELEWS